ncbi:MAG TPA: helix-turn-helix transcriptional regulator [Amnibacterium sp.]|uniref:helix-turn-helix transcriptional regulator n=1 Tax=Amnibacterium sp. TaxID=1872496 RepID=UPI002F925143
MDRSAVGEYLRARREVLTPADVGLPAGGRRRVQGLRRSEVAMLAGISPDYYLRLEQGRDGPPSDQVLNALGRALRLDDQGLEYLHRLAHPVHGHVERSSDHRVDDALLRLMALWTRTPAVVIDGCMDVLVSNPLAAALAPGIFEPGGNLVLAIFEPLSRQAAPNWEELAGRTVASLRLGADPDDPRLHDIVGELSADADFSRLWARHDVQAFTTGTTTHYVAGIGFVELRFQNLAVPGRSGLVLTTYFADEGSPGERALAHLAEQIDRGITVPAVSELPVDHRLEVG